RGDVGGEVHGQGGRAQRRAHGRRVRTRRGGGRRGRRERRDGEVLLDRQSGLRGLPVAQSAPSPLGEGERPRCSASLGRGRETTLFALPFGEGERPCCSPSPL